VLSIGIALGVGAVLASPGLAGPASGEEKRPIVAVIRGGADDPGLFVIDPASGRRIRRLTSGNMRRPFWSPDGSKVVFASGRYLNHIELWVTPAKGGHRRRLTHNNLEDEWPSWAPDSNRLVVERFDDDLNRDSELYVVRVHNPRSRNLTRNSKDDYCPSWSPDGKRVAFHRMPSGNIFTIRPDGTHERRMTAGPGMDGGAIWSPKGDQILFRRRIGKGRKAQRALFVIARDGTKLHRLTGKSIYAEPPYGWSPNGRKILFAQSDRDFALQDLWVMNSDGTNKQRLHAGVRETNLISPSWSPDGTRIVYSVQHSRPDQSETSDLWSIRADGSHKRQLTSTKRRVEFHPDWTAHTQECQLSW
jgi:Tol biopolymer transport system component